MKKLLALVLALVMTMGLATVGTNAATKFADDDTIKYAEAAAVMSAIGVFDGDDSNNFRPTATLKRSEAAKIVAYLMLTKKTADGLLPSGTRYNDVPANHWAAGYIEYLTSEGVLGGVGDGKFNPDGDITVVDYAKMLLVALGYDAKLENLVLSDYRINTSKLANQLGIFDGNTDAVITEAITRDQAALYAFNMIRQPMVEYDSNVRVALDNGNINIGNNKAQQKTSTNLGKQKISTETAARNNAYLTEFAEDRYPDLENIYAARDHQTGVNDLGQPVREWLYKTQKIGTYVRSDILVQSWDKKVTSKMVYDTLGQVYYDAQKNYNAFLISTLDGVRQDTIIAGVNGVTGSNRDFQSYIHKNNTTKINNSGNGTTTELYADKDRNLYIVSYNRFAFRAAGDFNESTGYVNLKYAGDTENWDNAAGTKGLPLKDNFRVDKDDFPMVTELKNDDYVVVTAAYTGNNDFEVKSIEKATMLTGKVDSYSYDEDYVVTIDGEKKSYGNTASADATKDGIKRTEYTVGEEAVVVLDKSGYIIAVDEAVVSNNYVFIREFGKNSGTLTTSSEALAAAVFTDGTTANIKVKKSYDYQTGANIDSKTTISSWNGSAAREGKWYTYSKNSAGEYTLYKIGSSYSQGNVVYTKNAGNNMKVTVSDRVSYLGNGTDNVGNGAITPSSAAMMTSKANDKTIMVVRDAKDKFNVYTGVKNLPDVTLTAVGTARVYAAFKTSDSFANVVYVDAYNGGAGTRVSGAANDNLVYVIKYAAASRTSDNEVYYSYVVLDGETEVTKEADTQIATGKIYHVANYATVNSKGQYTDFTYQKVGRNESNDASDTVEAGEGQTSRVTWSNGALTVGGNGYSVASDAKLLLVVGNTNGMTAGTLMNADTAADYKAYAFTGTSGASSLASRFTNYSCTYDYALRLDKRDGNTIKELYVTVKTAAPYNGTGSAGAVAANSTTANPTGATVNTGTLSAAVSYVAGKTSSLADQQNALSTQLYAMGYTVSGWGSENSEGGLTSVNVWNANGTPLTFSVSPTAYYELNLNGTIEYVKSGADSTTKWSAVTGNGTGYVDGGYQAYSVAAAQKDKPIIEKASAGKTIRTGYVDLAGLTVSSTGTDNGNTYAPYNTAVTLAYAAGTAGMTYNVIATVPGTDSEGNAITTEVASQALTLSSSNTFSVPASLVVGDLRVGNGGYAITYASESTATKSAGVKSVNWNTSNSGVSNTTSATVKVNVELTDPASAGDTLNGVLTYTVKDGESTKTTTADATQVTLAAGQREAVLEFTLTVNMNTQVQITSVTYAAAQSGNTGV